MSTVLEASPDGTSPAPAASPPRRHPFIALVVLVALVGGLVALVAASRSPAQRVRQLMDRQLKLAIAGRYGLLHATLSQKAKAECPVATFVGTLQALALSDASFWSLIEYHDINVTVRGDHAFVTYRVTYNGRTVDEATAAKPDIYVEWTAPTKLGPKPNLQKALAVLDREHSNQPGIGQVLSDKEYEAQKARLLRFGTSAPVLFQHGQWYDDADSHLRCGT